MEIIGSCEIFKKTGFISTRLSRFTELKILFLLLNQAAFEN